MGSTTKQLEDLNQLMSQQLKQDQLIPGQLAF